MSDESIRAKVVAMHDPHYWRHRLYQLRHFELLAELYLLDGTEIFTEGGDQFAPVRYGTMSRDKLISAIIDWRILLAVESVNCPGCWARPNQPCIVCHPAKGTRVGATPRYSLPRMYHVEREQRAARKVGIDW